MSDVVKNRVTAISKSNDEIDHFIDSVCGPAWDGNTVQVFTFNSIKPVPLGSTRYDTWGTKWDARFRNGGRGWYTRRSEGDQSKGFYTVFYEFETAWTAPWKIFDDLRIKFPKIEIIWSCKGEMINATWRKNDNSVLVRNTLYELETAYERNYAFVPEGQPELGGMLMDCTDPRNEPEPTHLHRAHNATRRGLINVT